MLLSNSFLVEFHDDTVSQIKEVEQLQFLRSCKLEQEECYKSLRLSFRGTPGGDGGGTAHPQHSRTAPTTETRELLLLFDDILGQRGGKANKTASLRQPRRP